MKNNSCKQSYWKKNAYTEIKKLIITECFLWYLFSCFMFRFYDDKTFLKSRTHITNPFPRNIETLRWECGVSSPHKIGIMIFAILKSCWRYIIYVVLGNLNKCDPPKKRKHWINISHIKFIFSSKTQHIHTHTETQNRHTNFANWWITLRE